MNSPLVRSASRHSITEAGLGSCIDHLGAFLDAQDHGDKGHGALTDLGMQTRPEYKERSVRGVHVTLPPGAEPELPNGGRRLYFFDPDLHLPMLIITYDDQNQEVEYYHYDRADRPGRPRRRRLQPGEAVERFQDGEQMKGDGAIKHPPVTMAASPAGSGSRPTFSRLLLIFLRSHVLLD